MINHKEEMDISEMYRKEREKKKKIKVESLISTQSVFLYYLTPFVFVHIINIIISIMLPFLKYNELKKINK